MATREDQDMAVEHHGAPGIHVPAPSYWPIVLAAGVLLMAVGVIFSLIISGVGIVVMLAAIVGWTGQNRAVEPHGEGRHE